MKKSNNIFTAALYLSKSPLGILALFILLAYLMSSIIILYSESITQQERFILIIFMAIFPFAILFIFTFLLTKHKTSLLTPKDFKDENNFVKLQMASIAFISAASSKRGELNYHKVYGIIDSIISAKRNSADLETKILWVDDCPEGIFYEKMSFENLGIKIDIAKNTYDAIQLIKMNKYNSIISDMGRKEGEREGYSLLKMVRDIDKNIPFFIYSSSSLPEHKKEALERGANGATNDPEELFKFVIKALINEKPYPH